MRNVARIAFVGLVLAVVSQPALAGEGCGGFDVVSHVFEASDSDGSGSISRQEYAAAGLERYGAPFDDYDADGDGQTSLEEFRELYDRHHHDEVEHEI